MRNFSVIEGLRGWMAWWVVLGHLVHATGVGPWLPHAVEKMLNDGDVAVRVFMIVSGFVITHLLLNKNEPYGPYILRRAFRIFPIYLVILLFALLTVAAYSYTYTSFPWTIGREMRVARLASESEYFFQHLGLHLTMLHGLVPEQILQFSSSAFLAPAWSLSLEWQFYLLAPFILLAIRRNWVLGIGFVILCLGIEYVVRKGAFGTWQYQSFLPLAIRWFLVGIISRIALEKISLPKVRAEWVFLGLFAVAAALRSRELAIWSLFYTFVLMQAGRIGEGSKPLKFVLHALGANQVITKLGRWSYSTYLAHVPIIALVGYILGMTVGVSSQQQFAVVIFLATVPLTLLASWLGYTFVEDPGQRLGRTLANYRQRRAIVTAD